MFDPINARLPSSCSRNGIPAVVIADGKYIYSNFSLCRTSKEKIDRLLSKEKTVAEVRYERKNATNENPLTNANNFGITDDDFPF